MAETSADREHVVASQAHPQGLMRAMWMTPLYEVNLQSIVSQATHAALSEHALFMCVLCKLNLVASDGGRARDVALCGRHEAFRHQTEGDGGREQLAVVPTDAFYRYVARVYLSALSKRCSCVARRGVHRRCV